ncbi:DUF4417 domain-containing protein [Sorangium sp. So ce764]|uniref:hypothetical protein n=1 Tax=Sorangium sp. So ce764 TaxID=3133320 RepID=UPI003F63EC50
MFGCFSACGACGVEQGKCDYTCPRKPSFWRDWVEVGGLEPKQRRELPTLELQLPLYVPMVRHGSNRDDALPLDVVALNTFDVMDSAAWARHASAASLRERFQIAPNAQILLVSVNQDRYIESFWAHRDEARLAALAQLGVSAMTTPNFSFFDDAPRLQSVRNFWRILRTAEDLADAGITPILHVNALSREDWRMWARVLRDNPAVRHVCKEFQTGLTDPQRAAEAIDSLRWLQDDVGRQLHPLVVGGRRVTHQVARHFSSFTIVDSVPFFATVKRKRIVVNGLSITQINNPTASEETLDALLQDNVQAYRKLVAVCATCNNVEIPEAFDEGEDIDDVVAI